MITLRARLDSVASSYHDSVNALRLFVDAVRRKDFERPELQFLELLLEMSFIYRVALFDAFLTDILQAVLVSRPEMLHSENKLTHEQILSCPDMPSMIALMAHRELRSIGYQSIDEQHAWVRLHLGIDLLPTSQIRTRMLELTARRNAYMHANGPMNERHLALTAPISVKRKPDRLLVTEQYWFTSDGALQMVGDHLLQEIYRKFCNAIPRAGQPGSSAELQA